MTNNNQQYIMCEEFITRLQGRVFYNNIGCKEMHYINYTASQPKHIKKIDYNLIQQLKLEPKDGRYSRSTI